jgi:hypothetical protein
MEVLSELADRDPENNLVLLYYLLSSMELDLQDQVLVKLIDQKMSVDHLMGQALTWYTSIALLKSDRVEEACDFLTPLIQQQGPYQSDARRMKKMMLK